MPMVSDAVVAMRVESANSFKLRKLLILMGSSNQNGSNGSRARAIFLA